MPVRDHVRIGAPIWIDLFTSDPDASRAFYTSLFGWTWEDPGPEYGGYFNFLRDGLPAAGGMVNSGDNGTADMWNVYLEVEDAEATVDATTANGGAVVAPAMAVTTLGTMAVLIDVGGAAIGAWQPGDHKGFAVTGAPGTPSWFELHTRVYDKTLEFYQRVQVGHGHHERHPRVPLHDVRRG